MSQERPRENPFRTDRDVRALAGTMRDRGVRPFRVLGLVIAYTIVLILVVSGITVAKRDQNRGRPTNFEYRVF